MSWCAGCGGVVGRDCFNPAECEWISRDIEMRRQAEEAAYYAQAEAEREREYRIEQQIHHWVETNGAPQSELRR